jgi:2'-5' RNA ligase
MNVEGNGDGCRVPVEERLNIFALVIYIPGPLGRFLDDLRRELVPHSNPHAHVSVLPPRPLAVDWRTASDEVRSVLGVWTSFEIELTGISVFPVTDVVYIQLGSGAEELRRMHAAMNSGSLAFHEPFAYHPHVTLAQEIPNSDVPPVCQIAEDRWREYRGPRSFRADQAVFVQSTIGNCWMDLAEYSLASVVVR